MVDSVAIRNFRTFNDVRIDDCRAINVLVGDNGSGKTAFLEAIFLAAGISPELILRTRTWRGSDAGQIHGSVEDIHIALWGDLFYRFQTNRTAVIGLKGGQEQTRSVTVKLNTMGAVRVIAPARNKPGSLARVAPILDPVEFRWRIRGMPDVSVIPQIHENKLVFPPVPGRAVKAAFFAANQTSSGLEAANRFSKLSRRFSEGPFVESLCRIYRNIENVSVDISAGMPSLFAAIRGIPEKIPLTLASGGINKLSTILLAIADQANGIVLIDEIENGFYYDKIPDVINVIFDFARFNNCQLFVSTHSLECLRAIGHIASEAPDDFSLIRTVAGDEGARVRQFQGSRFARAIEDNVELR